MRIVRSPSLWRDLRGITDYFKGINAEKTAVRFARAVDDTIEFIGQFPDLGNPWESSDPILARLRYRLVKRFKRFLIVYRRFGPRVHILRVFHASPNVDELLRQ